MRAILFIILLSSCVTTEKRVRVPDKVHPDVVMEITGHKLYMSKEVVPYIHKFIDDYEKKTGNEFILYHDITIVLDNRTAGRTALCMYNTKPTRLILFNRNEWISTFWHRKRLLHSHRNLVLIHEMLHCNYDMRHGQTPSIFIKAIPDRMYNTKDYEDLFEILTRWEKRDE